jgi:hypothetical protein
VTTATIEQFVSAVTKTDRIGQGTAVEQARAATQVQGAIYIAQQFPRNVAAARTRMLQACSQMDLAARAFYSYPRGRETISGLTIDVACEIAQCWGNLEYGLTEMRRDEEYGQSEMLAFAWDLETNVRNASTFIVLHVRETKKGNYRVTESRDIYEVNTNQGNRRIRAAIFKILPHWYVAQAEAALKATLLRAVDQSDKPLAEQIKDSVASFLEQHGITQAQLEHKAGRPVARWTQDDVVQLRILSDSLGRGDLKVEEAFPSAKVTAAEVVGSAKVAPANVPDDSLILHSDDFFGDLKAMTQGAESNGVLEEAYHRAVALKGAGKLTEEEFAQLDALGTAAYERLQLQAEEPLGGSS